MNSEFEANFYCPEVNVSLVNIKEKDNLSFRIAHARALEEDYTDNAVAIYTDGSVMRNVELVGSGIYVPIINLFVKHKLPSSVSIFSAEAWAMLQAIAIVKEHKWAKATIFTDSLSLLLAVQNYKSYQNNYLIARIKAELFILSFLNIRVLLCWIPSHSGIISNEIADDTAKKAAHNGHKPKFRILHKDLYAEAVTVKNRKFSRYLEEAGRTKGRMYTRLYSNKGRKP